MTINDSPNPKYLQIQVKPFTTETFSILAALPGFSKWGAGRTLFLRPTGANIEYLLKNFPDLIWEGKCAQGWKAQYFQTEQSRTETISKKLSSLEPDPIFPFKLPPFLHQLKAFQISKDSHTFGYLMDPGTGKTKVTIDAAYYRFWLGKIDGVVVVAPNGIHDMWRSELAKHAPGPFCFYIHSSSFIRKQATAFENCLNAKDKILPWFLFNIEAFTSNHAIKLLISSLTNRKCFMVIDESTRIKNPSALCTRTITSAGHKYTKYRSILTGTVATEGLENVYSQFYFLDPMILGHDTYSAFKAEYCVFGGYNRKEIVGYRNIQRLQQKIASFSIRVDRKTCLDIPEKLYQKILFDITPKQRELYRELCMELEAEFQNVHVDASQAMVKLIRLQQIACNWWPHEEGKGKVQAISESNPRLQLLLQILDDRPGKTIIWARFRADIELILSKIPAKYRVDFWGGSNSKERLLAEQEFQNNPKKRFWVGNQHAGGFGFTLTEAQTMIYYSNNFSAEDRIQSEDRTQRIGQKRQVLIIDLLARKTVDSKIFRAISKKLDLVKMMSFDPFQMLKEEEEEND